MQVCVFVYGHCVATNKKKRKGFIIPAPAAGSRVIFVAVCVLLSLNIKRKCSRCCHFSITALSRPLLHFFKFCFSSFLCVCFCVCGCHFQAPPASVQQKLQLFCGLLSVKNIFVNRRTECWRHLAVGTVFNSSFLFFSKVFNIKL